MNAVRLEPFDELIVQLRAHGFSTAAESIAGVRTSTWTSSSEMIGELGLAVLKIQSQAAAAPVELKQALRCCMKEVHKVWPDIKVP